jgi:hypothetical protein
MKILFRILGELVMGIIVLVTIIIFSIFDFFDDNGNVEY